MPLAVEIAFREGGSLHGCRPLDGMAGAHVLESGAGTYRAGVNEIRFGPGAAAHQYVQVRGAEPRLPGQSVYLTGYTPFDRTIRFDAG